MKSEDRGNHGESVAVCAKVTKRSVIFCCYCCSSSNMYWAKFSLYDGDRRKDVERVPCCQRMDDYAR